MRATQTTAADDITLEPSGQPSLIMLWYVAENRDNVIHVAHAYTTLIHRARMANLIDRP